jgi:hypothetical protein
MNEDFQQLVNLVKYTRDAQNQYFKVRTQSSLSKAKALEKRLDDFIAKHYQEPTKPKQTNLF